jgi:Domain of unknown function (DUF5076)
MSAFKPYDTLPVADEALDRGGVELLRVGLADEELFVTLRSPFQKPDQWGRVLADVTRHLADLYAANSDLTEDNVIAAVAAAFAQSLRGFIASSPSAAEGTQRKRPPPRAKAPAGSPAKETAPTKVKPKPLKPKPLKPKPVKSKPVNSKPVMSNAASPALGGRKGSRRRP